MQQNTTPRSFDTYRSSLGSELRSNSSSFTPPVPGLPFELRKDIREVELPLPGRGELAAVCR
jgi:hypothetical protein